MNGWMGVQGNVSVVEMTVI